MHTEVNTSKSSFPMPRNNQRAIQVNHTVNGAVYKVKLNLFVLISITFK